MTNTAPQNNSISTYNQYKDTGIPWLGKIPAHWGIERAKYLFNKVDERSKSGLEELLSVSEHFGVIKRKDTNVNMFKAASYIGYKLCKKNDLVINSLWAWKGGLGISDFNGIISTAYSVFRFVHNEIFPKYFHYLFRSSFYLDAFRILSKGIWISRLQLNDDDFLNLFVVLPPKPEQTAIARFLDRKTTQIDQAIAQKQALIDRLKTYKQVLIQQAVTKGLNPDAPLKDSGVEWIGQIPAHWEVWKLKFSFKFNKGLAITKKDLSKKGIPCINYGEIHSDKYAFQFNPIENKLLNVEESNLDSNANSLIGYGNFVFADTSEDIEGAGNFTYLNKKNVVFAGYHTLILKKKDNYLNSKFYAYFFDSLAFRTQIQKKVKGVKVYSITQSILKDSLILVIPKSEQTAIAHFLDRKTTQIDHSIALQEKEIKRLQTYKTVLIDQAVTGKIKVI